MIPLLMIAGLVLLAIAVLAVVWRSSRRRRLPSSVRTRLRREWAAMLQQADTHRKILDAETIVDHALDALGHRGTFADKLRTAGPRFSQLQPLWDAHKLRNRIAHDIGVQVAEADAARALAAFERALQDLS